MQKITEQQIQAMAPNAAAAANGKKIAGSGGFVRRSRSADDTFYMGECKGSGKSNYITSVDFIDPQNPVCRCSCPSRQFPCKHSLALLFEIAGGKPFEPCEIPEDILKKRARQQARAAREEARAAGTAGAPGAADGAGSGAAGNGQDGSAGSGAKKGGKAAPSKSSLAAREKKLKKQLEGIALAEKLVGDLLAGGLGAMGSAARTTYEQLAKQLGDHYLPGPQRLLNGLLLEIEAFQKDGKDAHYDSAIDILERLWTLLKKSRVYLNGKLERHEVMQDDDPLYEELGGVYKLSELEALGRAEYDSDYIQLAFWVTYDQARREYIDTGCWLNLGTGQVYKTCNYRPIKALKYVKEEDTVFGVAHAGMAAVYPGEGNQRIRWENVPVRPVKTGDIEKVRSYAGQSLTAESKGAKNLLKNALADPMLLRLVAFSEILRTDMGYVLRNKAGETILLGDEPGMEKTAVRLAMLPAEILRDQVLLGGFFYDQAARRLKLQPLSIVTGDNIIRLLY